MTGLFLTALFLIAWWAIGTAMLLHVWRKDLDVRWPDAAMCAICGLGGPPTGLIVWAAVWAENKKQSTRIFLPRYKERP